MSNGSSFQAWAAMMKDETFRTLTLELRALQDGASDHRRRGVNAEHEAKIAECAAKLDARERELEAAQLAAAG